MLIQKDMVLFVMMFNTWICLLKVSNQQASEKYLNMVKRSHFISSDKVCQTFELILYPLNFTLFLVPVFILCSLVDTFASCMMPNNGSD